MHANEVYVKVVVMIIFCWQFHTCSQLVFLLDLFWLKSLTFPSITLYNRFLSTTKHFRCQSWRTSSTLQTQYQARRSMINHSSSHVCVGEGSLQRFFLLILVETLRSYKWTDPVRECSCLVSSRNGLTSVTCYQGTGMHVLLFCRFNAEAGEHGISRVVEERLAVSRVSVGLQVSVIANVA
jgi:hypothetical protein